MMMHYHLSHPGNLLPTLRLPRGRLSMRHLTSKQLENTGASVKCPWSYSPSAGRQLRRETFDRYVNPGEGAIWDETITRIHGQHPTDPRIIAAQNIFHVWAELNHFIWRHDPSGFRFIQQARVAAVHRRQPDRAAPGAVGGKRDQGPVG